MLGSAAVALLALLLAGCGSSVSGAPFAAGGTTTGSSSSSSSSGSGGAAGGRTVRCAFSTDSQSSSAGRNVGRPPASAPASGTVRITLQTSAGNVPLTLNRTEAPCTVASFLFLARAHFFDNTICHRETAYQQPPLQVLQCGDPTGTGSGGPGYTIPDENPTNLAPAPASSNGEPQYVYPAGTIAMANTGQPHSGGSQFFLVYGNSYLPPSYAVFGSFDATGKATLAKIVAAGITPGSDPSTGQATAQDGTPAQTVTITEATVG